MSCFSDEFLNDLVLSIPASTHIKDACTGKYIDANKITTEIFNLSPLDMIGMTVQDIDDLMLEKWDKDFIPQVIELEKKVVQNKQTVNHTKAFLTMSGVVRYQNMIKIPIVGRTKSKVQRIFTTSENIVSKLELQKLWELYKKLYSNNIKDGINKFLVQTNVRHLFEQLPTEAELMIIIYNVVFKQPGSKYIANKLNTSPRTIDNHIAHISDKLIKDKTSLFSNMNITEGY